VVLWSWVRLKVHFVIWYKSHLKYILASVCWAYCVTRYWTVIGAPIISCPTHELSLSVLRKCVGQLPWVGLWGWVRFKVHFLVGVGGDERHPRQQTFGGKFHIENYYFGYKLVFCITGSPTCLDIGRFDAPNNEDGRRLNLTEQEAFDLVFEKVFEADKVIKSVVWIKYL